MKLVTLDSKREWKSAISVSLQLISWETENKYRRAESLGN